MAFQRRKLVEDLTWRKLAHINALHSNSAYVGSDGVNAKNDGLKKLETQFIEAIDRIYGVDEPEEEIDKSNPFFAHAYDGLPPLEAGDGTTVGEQLGDA